MPRATIWEGAASIKGSTESMRMALLTASLIGLQFTWGIEMTYCTPYLLALGLTKSRISLVWIAGPLSGLIMQPIVGIIADRSKSRYGRRRPFMVGGTILVGMCLMVLGWTKEIVHFLLGDAIELETKRDATIIVAVGSIYGIDFAINAVQASCRSIIVDTLPIAKQQLGQAWASRMVAVGHLVGYGISALDLVQILGPTLGDTQFKQVCLIAALALAGTVGITCWTVTERVLIDDGKDLKEDTGLVQMLTQILKTATNLPPRISAICHVVFWAWIGWFPFLFYSTTFVGEIYLRYDAPVEARQSEDTLGQIGRVGSMSLIVFSIITFAGSIMLPWVVKSPEDEEKKFTPRPPPGLAPMVTRLEKSKPSLLTAWMIAHLMFAGAMSMAPFITSVRSATTIIAICGLPWALQCWAPFTFMGIEINRLSVGAGANGHVRNHRPSNEFELEDDDPLSNNSLLADETCDSSTGELSGIYLGILNLFTTLPQFVGTFISWIVFSILEPGKSPELAKEAHPDEHHGTDGLNAIAVCLFIGAVSAVGAAMATRKLKYVR